jgi:hypothetical protein
MALKPEPRPRTKTGEKTLRGRPVWIDETGEITGKKGAKYSEVTTTIPFGTQFITAPTIDENGNRLSDDEVKQKLKDNQGKDFITGEKLPVFSSEEKAVEYAKWRSSTMFDEKAIKEGFPEETFPDLPDDTIKQEEEKDSFLDYLLSPSKHGVLKKPKYNKGGSIMNEQMQMAFMSEGGLKDDGMDKDPVSGNEVPSGSLAEEVRDDIPAQLSEGEYVVPADVVRYYGVKFFEDLRDRAKIGLAEMEANGRIGGEPVPDGGPVNKDGISPQEMKVIQEVMGMYGGGKVSGYQTAGDVTSNQIESNMLGGQTSAQVEQQMLSAANKKPYVGQPLGFSIFGGSTPATAQQTTQQNQAVVFETKDLYNVDGDFRRVTSAKEETEARNAGFNMTLAQYNLYRSQRGGTGGSGGTSGTITPPGEEKEDKPWGAEVNWDDPDAIRKFVDDASEGNISPKTGKFIRGIGFAIAGLPGAAFVSAIQGGQAYRELQTITAAQIIADARGHTELAEQLQKEIDEYKNKSGGLVNFLDDIFPTANNLANNVANNVYNVDNIEEIPDINKEVKSEIPITKKTANIIASEKQASKGTSTGKAKAILKAKASGVSTETAKKLSGSQMIAGSDVGAGPGGTDLTGPMNKGGLMTKGKKKKAKK